MPHVDHHDPGSFHWIELATSDQNAARIAELGGRVYAGPVGINETARFSVVADPQGAAFALFWGQA